MQKISKSFYLILQSVISRQEELRERARQLLEQARNQSKPTGYGSTVTSPVDVFHHIVIIMNNYILLISN